MALRDFLSKLKTLSIATVVIVVVVLMIVADGLVAVPPGHAAVIFDLGRGILDEERPEGLHLKIPFWQKAYIMDIRTQEYTMSVSSREGAVIGDDSIESRSKDGQIVVIDATVLYHVNADDASVIRQTLGGEKEYQQKIIRPKARSVIRDVVARYNALDLVSEVRDDVVGTLNERLRAEYSDHKITLEELVLRNVTFSSEFASAIEQKQVAFQKIKTAEYQKQEAEQLKERKIIEAQADAEAIRLKGETLRMNPEVIQFEFVQKMADDITWGILPDGVLPILDFKGMGQ